MMQDAACRSSILAPPDEEAIAAAAKLALRRVASTVGVVTCRVDGNCHAMTATAISAVSMAPPSMLVCVNRSASFHQAISHAIFFAINILSREQASVSRACGGASQGEDRFKIGGWDLDGDAPLLAGSQASIVCRREHSSVFGSHTIFIGQIVSVSTSDYVDPLIYCDGHYASRPVGAMRQVDPDTGIWPAF